MLGKELGSSSILMWTRAEQMTANRARHHAGRRLLSVPRYSITMCLSPQLFFTSKRSNYMKYSLLLSLPRLLIARYWAYLPAAIGFWAEEIVKSQKRGRPNILLFRTNRSRILLQNFAVVSFSVNSRTASSLVCWITVPLPGLVTSCQLNPRRKSWKSLRSS